MKKKAGGGGNPRIRELEKPKFQGTKPKKLKDD